MVALFTRNSKTRYRKCLYKFLSKNDEKIVLSTFITVRKSCRPKTLFAFFDTPLSCCNGAFSSLQLIFFIRSVLDSAMSDRI
jgi:hypothetical protein